MKTLTGMRDCLKKPNDRTPDELIPKFIDVAIDSLTHTRGRNGVESIRNYKLAEKLLDLQEPFDVEDAEFERLKTAIEENPYGYLSWAHGQAMIKLREWDGKLSG